MTETLPGALSDFLLLSNGVTEGLCSVETANKNQRVLNKADSV